MAATLPEEQYLKMSNLEHAFDNFDKDNDGKISLHELQDLVAEHSDQDLIKRVLSEADKDGDGEISFDEFK